MAMYVAIFLTTTRGAVQALILPVGRFISIIIMIGGRLEPRRKQNSCCFRHVHNSLICIDHLVCDGAMHLTLCICRKSATDAPPLSLYSVLALRGILSAARAPSSAADTTYSALPRLPILNMSCLSDLFGSCCITNHHAAIGDGKTRGSACVAPCRVPFPAGMVNRRCRGCHGSNCEHRLLDRTGEGVHQQYNLLPPQGTCGRDSHRSAVRGMRTAGGRGAVRERQ